MSRLLSLGLALALAGGTLLFPTACTFVLDRDAEQCQVDSDCTGRGPAFTGNVCEPTRKVCVLSSTYCESNSQCIDANGAENFICDKTEHVCKNLLSQECTRLLADKDDLRNDDVVIMGFPWTSSLVEPFKAGEDALEMARRDLKAAIGGIPAATPGAPPRPLVWVVCDTPDRNIPLREYYKRHMDVLVDRLHVPVMMGSIFADIVQDQVNRGVPAGTMIYNNAPSYPSFLDVPGARGLLFTFYPAIPDTNVAYGKLTKHAESKIRPKLPVAEKDRDLKVLFAVQASPVTTTSITQLKDAIELNGKTPIDNEANFAVVSLGNFGEKPTLDMAVAAVPQIEAFKPDIIICPTVSDCDNLVKAWEGTKTNPNLERAGKVFWIVNEAMFNSGDYLYVPEQEEKYLVLFAGVYTPSQNFREIQQRFILTFPDDFGTSPFVSFYHAGFMSAVLAGGITDGVITGAKMGQLLTNNVKRDGVVIKSELNGFRPAIDALRAGQHISIFDGLEVDGNGQQRFDKFEILCPKRAGSSDAYPHRVSSLYFDNVNKQLAGTDDCIAAAP